MQSFRKAFVKSADVGAVALPDGRVLMCGGVESLLAPGNRVSEKE